jgi:hypothetical protein
MDSARCFFSALRFSAYSALILFCSSLLPAFLSFAFSSASIALSFCLDSIADLDSSIALAEKFFLASC